MKICILAAWAGGANAKWCIWETRDLLSPSRTPTPPPDPPPHPPPLPLPTVHVHTVLRKRTCTAIFGGSWCHKWFEQWVYNCWRRFLRQSGKHSTASPTDQDLVNAQQQKVSGLSSLCFSPFFFWLLHILASFLGVDVMFPDCLTEDTCVSFYLFDFCIFKSI